MFAKVNVLGKTLAILKKKLVSLAGGDEGAITAGMIIREALTRAQVFVDGASIPTDGYTLSVEGAHLDSADCLVDIADDWHALEFQVAHIASTQAASRAPPSVDISASKKPRITTAAEAAASNPSSSPPTAGPTSASKAASAPPAARLPFKWYRCNISDEGFPRIPFAELNWDTTGISTVSEVRDLLKKLHGFDPSDDSVEVVIANQFVGFSDGAVKLCDGWAPEIEGVAAPTTIYYVFCQKHDRAAPCTIVSSAQRGQLSSLQPLLADSVGLQLLYGTLEVFSRRCQLAGQNSLLLNTLRQLHRVTRCPALVAAVALYTDNRRSDLSLYLQPIISQGLQTAFQALLTPFSIPRAEVLHYSRECFVFLMTAPPSGKSVFELVRYEFDDGNLKRDGAPHPNTEFVLFHDEIFDFDLLKWMVTQPTEMLFQKEAASWAAEVAVLQPDPFLRMLFLGRHKAASIQIPVSVTVTDAAATMMDVDGPSVALHDLSWCTRQADSPDFAEGCLRILNPRTLRSQKTFALFVRGNGTVGVFVSLSKMEGHVNASDPLLPKAGDADCDCNQESTALDVWLKGNPTSFLTMKLTDSKSSSSATPTVEDSRPIKEVITMLFDKSGSMDSQSSLEGMTRIHLCQQTVASFVDRLASYDMPFRVQLVSFDTSTKVLCPFTSIYCRLDEEVRKTVAGGKTSLNDAICWACENLTSLWPGSIQRRLFILSDGEDTDSLSTSLRALTVAKSANIVVDAICIGQDEHFKVLKAICLATGGLCLKASSTKELFHYFEAEPMLSIANRPPLVPVACVSDYALASLGAQAFSTMPKRPLSARVSSKILSASDALIRAQKMHPPGGTAAGTFRAVLRALAGFERDPHPLFRMYPSNDSIFFWLFIMEGPSGTAYEGGKFLGYIEFPDDYPASPPQLRMITPMYHCNINADGKVCHSILDRNWNRDIPLRRVFDCVYGLLLAPEPDDPLDTNIAGLYYSDRATYTRNATTMTKQYACGKLDDILKEIAPLSTAAVDQLQSAAPIHLTDPITHTLFEDPVFTPSGQTYSRAPLLEWLKINNTDPMSRQPLTEKDLIPNVAMKALVEAFKRDSEDAKSNGGSWWDK